MSKILNKDKKVLSEKNSFHISQASASALGYVNATGLALASTKVITSADEDLTFTFGRCAVGSPTSDYMYLAHRDQLDTTNYLVAQDASGNSYVNGNSQLYLTINNGSKLRIFNTYMQAYVPLLLSAAPTLDLHAATKKYVDDTQIITPSHFLGYNGFVDSTSFTGASISVAFSDTAADIKASYFVQNGGDFTVRFTHGGNGANNGKTASGKLYVSYDVDGGTSAWDVNGVNFDLALENSAIINIDDYGTPFTVADNSHVGILYSKDDNAGGAAGNMYIYSIVLVRQ